MHYALWHSLYRSSTRGPEDDSVVSKHVAPLEHYMFILPLLCLTELHPSLFHKHFGMEHLKFYTMMHGQKYIKLDAYVSAH